MTITNRYWATAPTQEIAQEVMTQFDAYRKWMTDSGYRGRIQTSYNLFYGFGTDGSFGLGQSEDGSKSWMSVPHFKNLLQRLHSLTTQAKLTYQPRAKNSDSRSQIQADFAKGLLEHYGDEKGMHGVFSQAVEAALVMFEAFIYSPWDFNGGDDVRPDLNGGMIKSGDQEFHVLTPFQAARSTKVKRSPFYILEQRVNKYDLIAQYPQFAQEIDSAGEVRDDDLYVRLDDPRDFKDDDYVTTYTLLHDRTSALPAGREVLVVGDTVLRDSGLQYKRLPVTRLSAGDVIATVAGDSPGSSLVSLQEGLDALFSAVVTNNLNHAVSNIYSKDPNLSLRALGEGQNLIVASEPPVAVALANSSPETYKLIDELVNHSQLLSGINSTTRGDPGSDVKTAGGQALMLAQAIQFISTLQENYAKAASDVATIVICNLQSFCSQPRLAYIGGVSRRSYVKDFTSEDVAGISRVSVDLGNPVMQTVSGRYEMAQQWIQMGIIKDPVKVNEFLRTGQVDGLTEDTFNDSILIREENEMIKKGETPQVLLTDMHAAHIMSHRDCFSGAEERGNPDIIRAGLAHIQAHIAAYKSIDPDLAAILGLQPLPSMTAPPPSPPTPGPAPEAPTPEVQGQPVPDVPNGTPPQVEAAYQQATANIPPTA